MDSVFCVLKEFIVMFERGVYGGALAKKHRYWPARIYGDEINAHFKNK